MAWARIVAVCILAAVVYGLVHDQITARVSLEYFTIGHPKVIDSKSPTLIGLVWGVIATWWMGLLLGVPLAACCRVGTRPRIRARDLLPWLGVTLGGMAVLAVLAGLAGEFAAAQGWLWLVGPLAEAVPKERHAAFLSAMWAHSASYGGGVLGGIGLCVHALRARRAVAAAHREPTSPA